MPEQAFEANFDALVGPTHNYAGLAYGNLASTEHGLTRSQPRAALLQGLRKMKLLADLGLKQGVLPPHERPDIGTLRRLGFGGSDAQILAAATRKAPLLLAACYSSSGMWAANAATVSPGADTADAKVHFTPANLISQAHRSIETSFTASVLRAIFPDPDAFLHHEPLPANALLSDEGAANHTRFCADFSHPGIELFVYGREGLNPADRGPALFPARQTLEASQAVARLHQLDPLRKIFARQNPEVIDQGVFHNDVISVGNGNVFFYHAHAFQDPPSVLEELKSAFGRCCEGDLVLLAVTQDEVTVAEAVQSYLFNSQLVTLPDGSMCLIAPTECRETATTKACLDKILAEPNPVVSLHYVDVRESMKNGGGPACLRLRVVLTERDLARTHQGILLTDRLYNNLIDWGTRRYREELHVDDLADPALLEESRSALDELTQILRIGSVYPFQQSTE
ncbi:MAG: N-succinylarginine dihydrolase [Desulfomonile tiedjei]|nr:N-succinylarginine dihydrolase [Desulfomonile tiedjei]